MSDDDILALADGAIRFVVLFFLVGVFAGWL